MVIVHGFSDHINRYYELFPTLASRGILCTGIDQRGWGRTFQKASEKGNTGPTTQVLADMASFIKATLDKEPYLPTFVFAHSMGGAIMLTMASTPIYKDLIARLSGILLESPYIANPPATAPSSITVFFGKLAGRFLPHHQIVQALPLEAIVHDPEVRKSVKADELCHNTGTLEMFAAMLGRCTDLSSGKLVLNDGVKALWLSHGTVDQCTSYDHSKEWFEREGRKIQDSEFKSYEGWSHQLHADMPQNRPVFAKDVGDWILNRTSGKVEQAKL